MKKLYNVEVGISYSDALRAIEQFADDGDFERLGLDVAERLARAALKIKEGVEQNRMTKDAKDTVGFWNTVNDITRGRSEYAHITFTMDELDKALESDGLTFMGRRIGYLDKVDAWTTAPKPQDYVTIDVCPRCHTWHSKIETCPAVMTSTFKYGTVPTIHTTPCGRFDSSKENTANSPKVGYGG